MTQVLCHGWYVCWWKQLVRRSPEISVKAHLSIKVVNAWVIFQLDNTQPLKNANRGSSMTPFHWHLYFQNSEEKKIRRAEICRKVKRPLKREYTLKNVLPNGQLGTQVKCDIQAEDDCAAKQSGYKYFRELKNWSNDSRGAVSEHDKPSVDQYMVFTCWSTQQSSLGAAKQPAGQD